MELGISVLLIVPISLLLGCSISKTEDLAFPRTVVLQEEINIDSAKDVKEKGWSHLVEVLVDNGIKRRLAEEALGSRAMPEKEILTFNLTPGENRSIYRGANTLKRRLHALEFYKANRETFSKARRIYQVPESVVLAILQVETSCGQFTGNKSVFPAIARLANARDPDVLNENLRRNARSKMAAVHSRASYLESTFLPHLIATFKIAPGGDVHALRGSFAGAMGIPQFMPNNIIKYGVDGNGDGLIDVYNPDDAILSTANYLKQHGWTSLEMSKTKKRGVIWEYNRSTPYIDTVLSMAEELQKSISPVKPQFINDANKRSIRKSSSSSKKFHR